MRFMIFVLFIFIMPIVQAEDCSVCQKKIKANEKYLKSNDGKIFCSSSCIETLLPACSFCGKKSKSYVKVKEKVYCSRDCASKLGPHCDVCQKSLLGKAHLQKDDKTYCNNECYLSTIKACQLCQKKSLDMFKILKKDFCGECVKGERCDACQLPSDEKKLNDDRNICKKCKEVGIQEQEEAARIYGEIKALLAVKYGIDTTLGLPMTLIDRNELKVIKGGDGHSELGFYNLYEKHLLKRTFDELGNEISNEKTVKEKNRHIYILSYLPKNTFRSVAAHELMHNWHVENYPQINDRKIEEGLAEYMAYLVNLHDGDEELILMKDMSKDPIYGDGYRLVKSWDKGNGMADIKAKLVELYGKPKKK